MRHAFSIGCVQLIKLGRTTEGFYDTALNEANDVCITSDSTKASPRRQTRKVCRRPMRKNHVVRLRNQYG